MINQENKQAFDITKKKKSQLRAALGEVGTQAWNPQPMVFSGLFTHQNPLQEEVRPAAQLN